MLSEMSMRPMMGGGGDGFSSEEMGLLLRKQRRQEASDWERELNIYRSGSAPPTVEGSLSAVGGLFGGSGNGGLLNASGTKQIDSFASEDELRSDPVYLEYYYSHVNLNPRLPPPLLSKEDWRFTQRLQAGNSAFGGIGDKRTIPNQLDSEGGRSLFSTRPQKEELEVQPWRAAGTSEWLESGDGLIGLPGIELNRQKNYDTVFQDDGRHVTLASGHLSRPASRNASNDDTGALISASSNNSNYADKKPNSSVTFKGGSSNMTEPDDLVAALSGMRLSGIGDLKHDLLSDVHNFLSSNSTGSSGLPNENDMNGTFSSYGLGGFSIDPALSSMMTNHNSASISQLFGNAAIAPGITFPVTDSRTKEGYFSGSNLNGSKDLHNHKGTSSPTGPSVPQMSVDPLLLQYLRNTEYAAQPGIGFNDPSLEMSYMANSYADLIEVQKAYVEALLQSEKNYGMPFINNNESMNLDNGYYGSPAFGLGYPGSPLASHVPHPSLNRLDSPLRNTIADSNMHFPSTLRNFNGSMLGAWGMANTYTSSLLDEFKNNKTKCYELSEIVGHVVEFSADQYGSRFIQQKLETATKEEKDMVFEEIMPQALTLMTDVFGNYVVQKFFEHGSAAQIRELADQLTGHVLALSLQMYGCRVIQKAIEVIELDQKTKMVAELDGHVMRCVRDQNGNHVIQKCIECIPEDAIQFIVSTFYGQIVTLSTHPYGCRVIQRILEHCHDTKTQQIMMDEILQSVCMLAQDQYGNYVVQHVLEHGKPHERSAIMNKLSGQIVQMSQQKFASNVIEKCLTFGDPAQRQSLVNEMLGSTGVNEPLEVMMKDQFANYVVQKVLETCEDDQREIILTRIKVHLSALKKYTYGKHIVARVEKLVAAGERRVGIQSACSS